MRIGDELIYYYAASSFGKSAPAPHRLTGGGIFRARLRRDGFVSVDSGVLTTPLLSFEGRELMLNAVGPVKVWVLDESGRTQGSAVVEGDSVRHAVRFSGQWLRQVAPGGRCSLRFEVHPPGQLYSFNVSKLE